MFTVKGGRWILSSTRSRQGITAVLDLFLVLLQEDFVVTFLLFSISAHCICNFKMCSQDLAVTGLDGFPTNPTQNATDKHDNQDGYGLMVSELLVNEFDGCSSMPKINPPDNMSLNSEAVSCIW